MKQGTEIIGIGTDILSIERFKSSYSKLGEKFLDKIFTDAEKAYCNKHKDPIVHFAVRFSAKEAVVKALGSGFDEMLTFHDIEISNNEKGKPFVTLSTKSSTYYNHPTIQISLSHCKEYATATAIAYKDSK